jgi:hypothetical protein
LFLDRVVDRAVDQNQLTMRENEVLDVVSVKDMWWYCVNADRVGGCKSHGFFLDSVLLTRYSGAGALQKS